MTNRNRFSACLVVVVVIISLLTIWCLSCSCFGCLCCGFVGGGLADVAVNVGLVLVLPVLNATCQWRPGIFVCTCR